MYVEARPLAASSASTGIPRQRTSPTFGLHALQHRGQESAGIRQFRRQHLHAHGGRWAWSRCFGERELEALHGHSAIGHVRYSTAGVSQAKNAQPLTLQYAGGRWRWPTTGIW